MPTPIKKVILSKTIDGVITMMYPKSSADVIEYQSGTVADALLNFATAVEDIIKEGGTIDSKIDALYKKIMGITDETTTVNEAYDTLVEVAEYLTEHGSVVQGFTSDISGLKSAVKDIQDAIGSMGGDISAIHQAQVYTVVQEDTTDVDAAIAALGDGITFGNGDVLIIKTSTGVQAGYQYDSDNVPAWAALDGNVSSDNIIFKEDIVLAGSYTQVGNITKGSTATGSIAAAGKSLTAVMQSIFTKELQPTKSEPSVGLTLTEAGAYEVGTKVTPNYAATFNKGAYTYGPDTGITVSSWEVSDTAGNTASAASGALPELTVEDGTNYKVTAKANHTEGAVALTNLGNATSVKIAAGSKSKVSGAITGYRKTFFGSKASPVDLTSANIRALTGHNSSTTSFSVTIVEGAKQVIIAVPTGKTLKSVADVGAFGTDIVGSFVKSTVAIEGANGYTAKDYNVYVYSPAAALSANTYNVTVQ